MPTVYTANSKSAAIAKAILGTCKPCCGSGSGSGSGGIVCPSGTCNGIPVPTSLVLSVNSIDGAPGIPTDDPDFLGDFTLTYLTDELIARDVDADCQDTNVAYGTGWFSNWFDDDDVFPGGGAQFRYYFDACTGTISIHYRALDGLGCYPDTPYAYNPDNYSTTWGIVDCDPYLATGSGPVLIGSVAA